MAATTGGVNSLADATNKIAGKGALDPSATAKGASLVGTSGRLMNENKDPPSAATGAAMAGSIGNLMANTGTTAASSGTTEAGSGEGGRRLGEAGSGEEGSGSGSSAKPRSAESIQFEMLRASISALGDATLKGSLDGEEPVVVKSALVQSTAARTKLGPVKPGEPPPSFGDKT